MANNIQDGGVTTILSTLTTSTGSGSWYRVHPKIGVLSFQAILTGSSEGYLGTASVKIEGSNDGSNANVTALGTISFTTVATPVADGFTSTDRFEYVRGTITALTSSTLSTGLNSLGVLAAGQML